eukprot:scaffold194108_cov55-Attheya_sp.AAC.1
MRTTRKQLRSLAMTMTTDMTMTTHYIRPHPVVYSQERTRTIHNSVAALPCFIDAVHHWWPRLDG